MTREGVPGGVPGGADPSPCPPADPQRESKENQWLGVSVKSQGPGGKIVVSASWGDSGLEEGAPGSP